MSQTKEKLREKYKAIRLGMNQAEVIAKSQTVCQKLIETIDWQTIKSLCAFQSITKLNEVEINQFLEIVKNQHPKVEIVLMDQSKNQQLPALKFDVVIVPCLAFDSSNYRLGWGGGFYDKFLAGQSQSLKIGVCFQNGFMPNDLPHETHDIRLDRIITETSYTQRKKYCITNNHGEAGPLY